ncbi:Exportin-2 [Porphyridium purpureum]|uniref:Exportin-2 n=1 Tax=Porphyridium purpureum TaxID=35688 RepID=A0A5J4Z168_PORPP|nr:Exportin-2 [Porphyridium purpureum]|eukprot:POR5070..scf208_2
MGSQEMVVQVGSWIEASLSPDATTRRQAEHMLQASEGAAGFAVVLLQLMANESAALHVRQAAAVYFKNLAKRKWEDLPEQDRTGVKEVLIRVMLSSPLAVRRQLSEVMAIIAEFEYPEKWPQLMPELSAKLKDACEKGDWQTLQGVAETLDAVFERYRFRFRSDDLFREILYSLEHIAIPLTAAFGLTSAALFAGKFADLKQGELMMDTAQSLVSTYHSLLWQDIPAVLEDHLKEWMEPFLRFMSLEVPNLEGSPDELEPSCLDKVHAAILDVCSLFQTKYEEEFRPYLSGLIAAAWTLLVKRGNAPKFDSVATRGILFLTIVSKSADYAMFKDPGTLQQICEKIVIPNIELRAEDEEQFEDNPMEYIRRDMEGADAESRRSSAVELVKGLTVHFESQVTETFSAYVTAMLASYQQDPAGNWKSKDAAIYIVTALGWKSGTKSGGATQTSQLVNVLDFFKTHVASELSRAAANPPNIQTPILVADAIKFATLFRNQINKELYGELIGLCISLASSSLVVIHTYAAICIERLLSVKDTVQVGVGSGAPIGAPSATTASLQQAPYSVVKAQRFGKTDLERQLPTLLATLFALLGPGRPENEYIMRCVLRIIVVSQDLLGAHVGLLIQVLRTSLEQACTNPANPRFNHYLFDAIASLIRQLASRRAEYLQAFEAGFFGIFQNILANDVVEFIPYVLQILAQLLDVRSSSANAVDTLPAAYGALLPPLLSPALWDRSSFIPGMVQFIQAFVRKAPDTVMANNQLPAVLGIFQKLVASKTNDQHGIGLLSTCVEVYPLDTFKVYLPDVIKILVIRLQTAKTSRFVLKFLALLGLILMRYGVAALVACFDALQQHLFATLLQQVWLKDVPTVAFPIDRKLCSLGGAVLISSDVFTAPPYNALVGPLLNTTIALLEGIQMDALDQGSDDETDIMAAGAPGGGDHADNNIMFAQLAHAAKARHHDPFPDVSPRAVLVEHVSLLMTRDPDVLGKVGVEPAAQAALASYFLAAGKTLGK